MKKRKIPLALRKWSSNICVNLEKRTNSLEASRRFKTKEKLVNNDFLRTFISLSLFGL